MSMLSAELGPITKIVGPYTPDPAAFDATRALIASEAITVDLTDAEGNAVEDVPLVAGVNSISATKITAKSAGTVYLGY